MRNTTTKVPQYKIKGYILYSNALFLNNTLFSLHKQGWQPSRVPVWAYFWEVCWWRSWTCLLWEPYEWPCWSIWSPLPVTCPSSSWAVTQDLSLGWPSPMATSTDGSAAFFSSQPCYFLCHLFSLCREGRGWLHVSMQKPLFLCSMYESGLAFYRIHYFSYWVFQVE